jgi:hypothetical protein
MDRRIVSKMSGQLRIGADNLKAIRIAMLTILFVVITPVRLP